MFLWPFNNWRQRLGDEGPIPFRSSDNPASGAGPEVLGIHFYTCQKRFYDLHISSKV